MRYENVKCTACGKLFAAEDDVVVCPICGAPHHRACWLAAGKCAMNEAHGTGYAWIFPEDVLKQRAESEAAETHARQPQAAEGRKLPNGENVVQCPSCGAPNYGNDIYCMRCGARLDGEPSPMKNDDPDDAYDDYDDDAYDDVDVGAIRDDFNRFGGISPNAPVDGIPCWEYAEYVGGSKPGKIVRKVSTMERFGRKLSWMWAALIFGPIWFFWRKMKKEGAVLTIIMIFLAACMGISQLDSITVDYYKKTIDLMQQATTGQLSIAELQEQMAANQEAYVNEELEHGSRARGLLTSALEYCVMVGMPILCSLLAVPLYRKKVKADIMEIRGRCGSMDEYTNTLRAEGGTSAGLAVLGVILMLAVAFCAVFLPIVIVALFM